MSERVFPPGGLYRIKLPGFRSIPVWATEDDEAVAVAMGVIETDGALYR